MEAVLNLDTAASLPQKVLKISKRTFSYQRAIQKDLNGCLVDAVFVCAAAPADTPKPPFSLNKTHVSVRSRVEGQGWNETELPRASGGGSAHAYIHKNRHYCHYQLMGSSFILYCRHTGGTRLICY